MQEIKAIFRKERVPAVVSALRAAGPGDGYVFCSHHTLPRRLSTRRPR